MPVSALRAVRLAVLLSLLVSTGAHVAFVQAFAFAKMTVEAVRRGEGLAASLKETFDGEHPCAICVSVRAASPSETLGAAPAHAPLIFVSPSAAPAPASVFAARPDAAPARSFSSRDAAPPVPPPPAALA